MTQTNCNINSRKGTHLSYSERCQIAVLKKEDYSNRQIANVLQRAPQTINNEINRGTIIQLKRQNRTGKTTIIIILFMTLMLAKLFMKGNA